MGNASLMFYSLQNIFTVIISFGSQNRLWWRPSGYCGFFAEKPPLIEVLSLARTGLAKSSGEKARLHAS